MKTILKTTAYSLALLTLTGCVGSVSNIEKNCTYSYVLHPALSISRIIGGCGPAAKK